MERGKNINPTEIISGALRKIETTTLIGNNQPIASIKEIARSTGLDPELVFRVIQGGTVIVSDGDSEKVFRATTQPALSAPKKNDKIRANIQKEGQRFVRRFQFQDRNAKGRPLSRRIDSRIEKSKKLDARVFLTPFDPQKEKSQERENIKKELALRWMSKSAPRQSEKPNIPQGILARANMLKKLGIWDRIQDKTIYSFRLSEEVLALGDGEKEELEEISRLIYMPGGYIDGSLRLFADIDSLDMDTQKILCQGINPKELEILKKTKLAAPAIARLDLVLTRSGDPSFQIVEIEGDKTHAFGYVSLGDEFRTIFNGRSDTPGIIQSLKSVIERSGLNPEGPIVLIVGSGSGESFYLRELSAFSILAKKQGLNIITVPESQLTANANGVFIDEKGNQTRTIINIPKMINNEGDYSAISAKLLNLYSQGLINVLISPSRFLGGKGLLGLISNGLGNPQTEAVLLRYFDPAFLQQIRKFIPPTANIKPSDVDGLVKSDLSTVVIKKVMASGMKGVALPGDRKKQLSFLEEAKTGSEQFVIQKLVDQKTLPFSFVEPASMSVAKEANMYMRISLFACPTGLSTVGVTARETPDVHGAKDSIQIPVIFTKGKNDK